jgi:hypothetical protein
VYHRSLLKILAVFCATLPFLECAPTVRPDYAKETEGFELPGSREKRPGTATVYVARPSLVGKWAPFHIFAENARIDSLEVGSTRGAEHIWFAINPGKHRLISVAENTAIAETDFQADSTYFFRQDARPGFFMARNELMPTDSLEGKYNVKITQPGKSLKRELAVSQAMRSGGSHISARGLHVSVAFDFGGVTGGLQSRSGLVNDNGDKATTDKVGVDLDLRYYIWDRLAIEARTGGLWGHANAPKTKPMDFTNAWSSDWGLVGVPWQTESGLGLLQFGLAAGFNYTRLALAKEFKDFVSASGAFVFNNDAATGIGWYAGPDFRILMKNGFLIHSDLRYIKEKPRFPKGEADFDADEIIAGIGLGYKF